MSKPILYFAEFSPPARAVLLTAKLIDLELEIRNLDFAKQEHLAEEFVKINPQHTIPTLIDGGEVLWDSHAIMPYLVGKYAKDDSLYPKNLITRARVDQRLHFDTSILFGAIKSFVDSIIFGGETEFRSESLALTDKAYGLMESFLTDDYLVGNTMTVADISCVSDLNTLADVMPFVADTHPRLTSWMARMAAVPAYHEVNDAGAKMLAIRLQNCLIANQTSKKKNQIDLLSPTCVRM